MLLLQTDRWLPTRFFLASFGLLSRSVEFCCGARHQSRWSIDFFDLQHFTHHYSGLLAGFLSWFFLAPFLISLPSSSPLISFLPLLFAYQKKKIIIQFSLQLTLHSLQFRQLSSSSNKIKVILHEEVSENIFLTCNHDRFLNLKESPQIFFTPFLFRFKALPLSFLLYRFRFQTISFLKKKNFFCAIWYREGGGALYFCKQDFSLHLLLCYQSGSLIDFLDLRDFSPTTSQDSKEFLLWFFRWIT